MNKYKKLYKGLNLSELQEIMNNLKQEEIELREKWNERILEGAIEEYISDKRTFKDFGWFGLGMAAFQAASIFMYQPIKDAPWANLGLAGICAASSVLTIIAMRKGFDKDKKKLYEERKEYLLNHPEEIDKFAKRAPRYDESLYLDINRDKQIVVSELIVAEINKNNPVFPEFSK